MSKIIVNIPDDFLRTIDKTAKQEHRSRSELLREALRLYLSQRQTRIIPLKENPYVQWAIKKQDASRRKLRYPKISTQEAIRLLRGKI
jgi:metal-responsive CopG/Arc/MetJ family transcriptional regulator